MSTLLLTMPARLTSKSSSSRLAHPFAREARRDPMSPAEVAMASSNPVSSRVRLGLQFFGRSDASGHPITAHENKMGTAGQAIFGQPLVGDIVTVWNGKPIERVREIMRLLGPESIGSTVDLGLIRGGAPTALRVVIGERPVA